VTLVISGDPRNVICGTGSEPALSKVKGTPVPTSGYAIVILTGIFPFACEWKDGVETVSVALHLMSSLWPGRRLAPIWVTIIVLMAKTK
jgi:hypothetical protein